MHKQDEIGVIINSFKKYPVLTRKEEVDLFESFYCCREAIKEAKGNHICDVCEAPREKIVESNLKLVFSIAKKYFSPNGKLSTSEYYSMGCMGLLRAICSFDIRRGYKFSTYAVWWIRQAISRNGIIEGSTIRVPVSSYAEELSKRRKKGDMDCDAFPREVSTETVVKGGVKSINLGDLLQCENEPVVDKLCREERVNIVKAAVKTLPKRERFILEKRYFSGGSRPVSLDVIGKELGVTRERIRQLEQRGIAKVRVLLI